MAVVIFILVGLFLAACLFVWTVMAKDSSDEQKGPFLALPGFPISGYNVLWHIRQALPDISSSPYRWEIYTEKEGTKDIVVLNLLHLSTTQVINVCKQDVSTRKYNASWSGLAGCSYGFMREQVRDDIIAPMINQVDRVMKKIPGLEDPDKSNYFIV